MNVVFETIYYFAIGLIAITVTVFVLAVSLLGRAVKLSLEEQEKAENERKADTERTRAELKGKLEQATYDRESLEKSLKESKKKAEKHERTLRWIRWKPKLLKANWGVFVPSAFFVIAIGISALARYQLGQHNNNYQYYYLGASLFSLLIGIGFICLTLKVVEGVAITSDETAFVREAEVLKKVLLEIEEVKKPELGLMLTDENPPYHFNVAQIKTISVYPELKHGEAARSTIIGIVAPKGFNFPGMTESLQTNTSDHPGYIGTFIHCGTCIHGIAYQYYFTIKAPNKKDIYTLYWEFYCENSPKKEIEFQIIVE